MAGAPGRTWQRSAPGRVLQRASSSCDIPVPARSTFGRRRKAACEIDAALEQPAGEAGLHVGGAFGAGAGTRAKPLNGAGGRTGRQASAGAIQVSSGCWRQKPGRSGSRSATWNGRRSRPGHPTATSLIGPACQRSRPRPAASFNSLGECGAATVSRRTVVSSRPPAAAGRPPRPPAHGSSAGGRDMISPKSAASTFPDGQRQPSSPRAIGRAASPVRAIRPSRPHQRQPVRRRPIRYWRPVAPQLTWPRTPPDRGS